MAKYSWNKRSMYEEDSKFESDLRTGIFKDLEYHPTKIAYVEHSTYEPDWVVYQDNNFFPYTSTIYIEAKGCFRDGKELKKYLAVRDALDALAEAKPYEDTSYELVFLFQKPFQPLYFRAKRKDGTKMTHAEWAEKNDFRWFTVDTIKEIL